MAHIFTRINVGDYDAWKPMFDQDTPGTRRTATAHRLFRNTEDPNEVFIQVDFDSADDAIAARELLLASGVLNRFSDLTGPTVVVEAEAVRA